MNDIEMSTKTIWRGQRRTIKLSKAPKKLHTICMWYQQCIIELDKPIKYSLKK